MSKQELEGIIFGIKELIDLKDFSKENAINLYSKHFKLEKNDEIYVTKFIY